MLLIHRRDRSRAASSTTTSCGRRLDGALLRGRPYPSPRRAPILRALLDDELTSGGLGRFPAVERDRGRGLGRVKDDGGRRTTRVATRSIRDLRVAHAASHLAATTHLGRVIVGPGLVELVRHDGRRRARIVRDVKHTSDVRASRALTHPRRHERSEGRAPMGAEVVDGAPSTTGCTGWFATPTGGGGDVTPRVRRRARLPPPRRWRARRPTPWRRARVSCCASTTRSSCTRGRRGGGNGGSRCPGGRDTSSDQPSTGWRCGESNPGPQQCDCCALPTELHPRRALLR